MKSFIKKSISFLLVAIMLFGAGSFAGTETSLFLTKAQAASYPSISALKIPRIKQISGDSACYLCSFASVEAYHRGTYSGTTFSFGTDYSQSVQLYKDIKSANDGSVGWSSTIHNKYGYSKDNSPTLADIYKQLSLGKPVIVYGTSSTYGTHASVIIGYNGSSSTLEQSGFTVMEINASYWKNSQSIFNSYANNPQTYSTGGGNCYVTLSSWLSKASRTMNFITYRTEAPSYTLTYDANGGSGAPASQKYTSSFTISTVIPYRTGYSFEGWASNSPDSSLIYSSGSSAKNVTGNTTLYAVWRKNNLKVYYNANGGSISSDDYTLNSNVIYKKSDSTKYYQSWTYNSAKSNGLLNASTFGIYKTGYSFAGWGTSSSGGTIFDSNDTSIVPTDLTSSIKDGDCSITLYAQWKKNTYTLTYNANGGSNPPSAQSGSTIYTISSTKPTRSGYTFLGWSTNSSATSASYSAGDRITLTANTTLYAVWEKNATYTLTYNANGGSNPPSAQSGSTSYTISSTKPTRSGYTFLGWSKSSSATSASYSAGDKITLTANTTLYAVWEKNATYTLTYNANGGSNPPSAQSGSTSYTISSTKPTRSGYTFLGWSTSSSATSASYSAGDKITLTANTTLYAVWEKIPVVETVTPTIKIKNNPETTTIKYGDILQLTAEVTNMPEGAYVVWYYNGTEGAFEYGKSDDNLTCMILSLDNGSTKITAVVVDESGNPILDADGNEISDSQIIKSKAGFWQLLLSLLKTLFGINRIVVQSFNKFI